MTSSIPYGSRWRCTARLGIVDADRRPEGSGGSGGRGSEAGESKDAKVPGMHDWWLIRFVICVDLLSVIALRHLAYVYSKQGDEETYRFIRIRSCFVLA